MRLSFISSWVLRASILITSLLCYSDGAFAQAGYLTIFGKDGAGCSSNNRMTCQVAPASSSFLATPYLVDIHYPLFGYQDFYKNGTYNGAGQLLFSVNIDGIYAPDGSQVFGFSVNTSGDVYDLPYDLSCGSVSLTPGQPLSEIVTVPKPGSCNGYYVMFWNSAGGGAILRVIEVDITASYGNTAVSTASWYSFPYDDALDQPTCTGSTYNSNVFDADLAGSAFEIAADALNTDGSRDIYTVNPDGIISTPFATLRKWHINADGTLPINASTKLSTDNTMNPAVTTKAKIFTVGSDKLFGYVSHTGFYGDAFITFNLATGALSAYIPPTISGSIPGFQSIWGFEYLPSPKNVFCFAYDDESFYDGSGLLISTGGLGYSSPVSGSIVTITPISSTTNYCYSDLELNKNGDMLLVHDDFSDNPSLAYLSHTSLNSTFTSSSPTILTGPCTGSPNISNYNWQMRTTDLNTEWYLGNQIRGEDYSKWGPLAISSYTITGATTWTPTSNPVHDASGVATSVITANNIAIQPGGSLHITDMTVEMASDGFIDVNNSTSTGTLGGRLTLTNSTLTRYTNSCTSASTTWGGVRVWGSAGATQTPITSSRQGYVQMTNSTISYAKTGVALGDITTTAHAGGGGAVQASNSTFYNNNMSIYFVPYANISTTTHSEVNNFSSFRTCTFNNDDISILSSPIFYDINGTGVKGVNISASHFTNEIPSVTSYGIYGENMGFNVIGVYISPAPGAPIARSSFSDFTYAIYHDGVDASHTPSIAYTDFNSNTIGVELSNSMSPIVTKCTFGIPLHVVSPTRFSGVQAIGINMLSAHNYSIYSNTFQSVGTVVSDPSLNHTVGVLADNTVTDVLAEEQIHNNTYKGLGAANLSNYKNYDDLTGLWYKCNTNTNNIFDISATGADYTAGGDGIRYLQGLNASTYYAGHLYADGSTAGNTFSAGSSYTNMSASYVVPITYLYSSASGASILDQPGTSSTGIDTYTPGSSITITPFGQADQCALPGSVISAGSSSSTTAVPVAMHRPAVIALNDNPVDAYMAVKFNINYYMNDSDGVNHRDSLYYWVGQLNSGVGELTRAYLLLEDGYADSATIVYDSINIKYPVDSISNIKFTTTGAALFNAKKRIISYYANINKTVANAYANSLNADSVLAADSSELYYPILDGTSLTSLVSIFNTTHAMEHFGAEGILSVYAPDTAKVLIEAMPDTLVFPSIADGTVLKSNPGVLAVTEISQGPLNNTGCQYAEMIVANCGADAGDYSDVSGWIIDDNSGNFDTASCTTGNAGINRGHYRLAPDNILWQNIKVGTMLVMYNASVNCYGLPDTMSIDSVNDIVYMPIPGTSMSYLQRYAGAENASASSYCSDTGTTVYSTATSWATTVNLDDADGIQVRCPGCTTAAPGSPAFYHGIAYEPDATYCMNIIPQGAHTVGGALKINNHTYQKYTFTGGTLADFRDSTKWIASAADAAGAVPASVGHVDSTLYAMVTSHSLGMPCCGSGGGEGERKANTTTNPGTNNTISKAAQGITVYPNPASMTINFEFPVSGNVMIKLMDITGRTMDEQVVNNQTIATFNVKGYAAGLYLYQVITDGKTQSGKFIVK